uniref:Uncharacterized protein n=1 Tax=mine drainage metagenome TaxID=410659 RepID=E6QHY0_9ZZZZ
MDKTALVSFDIENGQHILNALEHDGKSPDVALWAVLPEYEDWRLVIASQTLDPRSSGNSEINLALQKANVSWNSRPTIFLRRMDEPFIAELRRIFALAGDTYGMRLGGQKFGDQYIEDAFVYRIR